jgi:release factor glutamine methyltransferase
MTSLGQVLRQAWQNGLERLDAQLLLLHALGKPLDQRAWLLAHDTEQLHPSSLAVFSALCQRRLAGEPVAYLTGERAFYGLRLQVDARVLDPRPDTETLVDWALQLLDRCEASPPTVLDLGTGSGAIALAIQHQRPDTKVWAVDASEEALQVAQANAQLLGLPVQFRLAHWFGGWAQASHTGVLPAALDLIVSNPPYIRDDDPHLAGLRHEPQQALTSGPDGLDDLRQIIAQAPHHLAPGGWLLLEHGWDQADAVADLLHHAGLQSVQHRFDLAGHRRCTGAQHCPTA